MGVWEHGEGVCALAGGLDQGLGCVRGQTIRLHPGKIFLRVQSVPPWRQN